MIKIKALAHQYNRHKQLTFDDWSIGQSENWLLSGKSGTGKTTLLHIISGLLKPSQGSVAIKDTDIYALKSNQRDHFRGQHIGIVFQQNHLINTLTVEGNVLAAQYFAGQAQNREAVKRILASLDIAGKSKSYPDELSHGQQQRVGIARALINSPTIIIADEPTSSLDHENARIVVELLKEKSSEQGSSLIVSTHDDRVKPYFDNTYTIS